MDALSLPKISQCGGLSAAEIALIFEGKIKGSDVRRHLSPVVAPFFNGLVVRPARCSKMGARCQCLTRAGLTLGSCTSRAIVPPFIAEFRTSPQNRGTMPSQHGATLTGKSLSPTSPNRTPVLTRPLMIFPLPSTFVAFHHRGWLASYRGVSRQRVELSCSLASRFRQ